MRVKLVRKGQGRAEEGRGDKAPVLLARQNRLAKRLGRASRGYVLAGAGVVVGAVVVVSLLSWLAPDSDRPVGHPLGGGGRGGGGGAGRGEGGRGGRWWGSRCSRGWRPTPTGPSATRSKWSDGWPTGC